MYFYMFIFLHELAHILVALILKIKLIDVSFLPFGVNARFDFENHKIKEILISFAGPILSLIFALYLPKYRVINLFILITNLIPIFPLDGGRILKNIICLFVGTDKGLKVYKNILKALILILLILNIFMIIFLKNYRFLFVSLYIIQVSSEEIKKEQIRATIQKYLELA